MSNVNRSTLYFSFKEQQMLVEITTKVPKNKKTALLIYKFTGDDMETRHKSYQFTINLWTREQLEEGFKEAGFKAISSVKANHGGKNKSVSDVENLFYAQA